MEKLIITPKEDKAVTMTIRIDRRLQEKYNQLSANTNRSRNELIGMALQYALDHMEIIEKEIENRNILPNKKSQKVGMSEKQCD